MTELQKSFTCDDKTYDISRRIIAKIHVSGDDPLNVEMINSIRAEDLVSEQAFRLIGNAKYHSIIARLNDFSKIINHVTEINSGVVPQVEFLVPEAA